MKKSPEMRPKSSGSCRIIFLGSGKLPKEIFMKKYFRFWSAGLVLLVLGFLFAGWRSGFNRNIWNDRGKRFGQLVLKKNELVFS